MTLSVIASAVALPLRGEYLGSLPCHVPVAEHVRFRQSRHCIPDKWSGSNSKLSGLRLIP
jgi:hypothetical protein